MSLSSPSHTSDLDIPLVLEFAETVFAFPSVFSESLAFQHYHRPVQVSKSVIQCFQDLIPRRQPLPVDGLSIEPEAGDKLSDEHLVLFLQTLRASKLIHHAVGYGLSVNGPPRLCFHNPGLYHKRSTSATPCSEVFA